ncbi:MAG: glycosyltransferase family 4 protein [Flavobacteriaceae bacterium]|nr:glycosyltransferase family 4 protein [Flavobacteriaceae bacterium]
MHEQNYYDYLLKKIDNCKKKIKIRFLGEINNPFPILKNSMGLINVSAYESFSYVVHEAMALKIPVISFLKKDNKFITEENVIVINEEPAAFIDILRKIYSNEIDTQTKVEKAYCHVQKFDIDNIVEKYDELFSR